MEGAGGSESWRPEGAPVSSRQEAQGCGAAAEVEGRRGPGWAVGCGVWVADSAPVGLLAAVFIYSRGDKLTGTCPGPGL